MSRTCVKSPTKLAFGLLCAAALLSAPSAYAATKPAKQSKGELESPATAAISVSDTEFNTFVFPDVIKKIYFPGGTPVSGDPIYLGDNSQVMLQFAKNNGKPIQMVAELMNDQVIRLRLVIKSIPGITLPVNGAQPRVTSQARRVVKSEGPAEAGPRSEDIELLKQLVSFGQPPSGFDSINLPAPTRFDKFSVVPLAGWSDGMSKRILVFSLVAVPGQTAVVSPPQFYRPGITAVLLDGDAVDASNSPQLFVVEELSNE